MHTKNLTQKTTLINSHHSPKWMCSGRAERRFAAAQEPDDGGFHTPRCVERQIFEDARLVQQWDMKMHLFHLDSSLA